jgi:hypothetical protein
MSCSLYKNKSCKSSKSNKSSKAPCKRNAKANKSRPSKSLKRLSKSSQRGGVAPSCLNAPDTTKYLNSCYSANLHNTNPEASFNLIEGEGILPSTPVLSGGGDGCVNLPLQKGVLSFTDYLNRASLEITGGGAGGVASNFDTTSLEAEKAMLDGHGQTGGSGFSINPEEMIGGLPGRAKYDSCCQPAIIGGRLTQGKGTGAICGHQMGGKGKKRGNKRNSKTGYKSSKGKRTMKRNKQMGGVGKYPFTGENGDFDYLAHGKDFAGKQPYWSVKTR